MLLKNLIQDLQGSYIGIQKQIDALQEQQREIQAQLQKVGSVESKMLAAAQSLQAAIADINDACPEQLTQFKETINGLFVNPVAALEATDIEIDLDEETVEPHPPTVVAVGKSTTATTVDIDVKQDGEWDQVSSGLATPKIFRGMTGNGKHSIIFWRVEEDPKIQTLLYTHKIRPANTEMVKASETLNKRGYFQDGKDCYTARITKTGWNKIRDYISVID